MPETKEHTALRWHISKGGTCGPNLILKLGDRYIGHFYIDADDGIDAEAILNRMADLYNRES